VSATAAVLLSSALLVGPAQPAGAIPTAGEAAAAAVPAAVTWTPCQSGFQCATIEVPLDYGQPAGAKISLAVVRLPAGDPSRRIGSLFLNPGGPGGSGVDLARGIAPVLPLELRGRFDIVGFDPRGIIRSTPLRCFKTFEEAISVLPPFAFPVTTQEENVQRDADQALASACKTRGGPARDHMSTADVARDMDHLRQLLGDSKLNYLGFSYGSMLGQVYANLFPNKVRAIVIDGVLDPIAWSTGKGNQAKTLPFTTRLRSDQGAQATLDEFFRLCDAAGDGCAFSGNSKKRFDAMAKKIRQKPITDPDGNVLLTYADLIGITLGGLYASFVWPDMAFFFADVEAEVSATALRARLGVIRTKLGLDDPDQEPYPNFIEGFPGVGCSDSVNPNNFAAWRKAADNAERQFGHFGRIWNWASSICLPWPATAGQDHYLGPWTARTASPVLVVGNFFDPATRYEGAVAASKLLPNSRLLSYAGWGHTAFMSGNFCVDNHVTRYLVTTKVPAAKTVCQPLGSPFEPFEPEARARAASTMKSLGVPMLPAAVRQAIAIG